MTRLSEKLGHLSIRSRILGICGGLSMLTALVGAWGIWAFSSVDKAFQITATQTLPAVKDLVESDRDMQQALVAERSLMFMNMATPAAKEHVKVHDENLAEIAKRWKKYATLEASAAEGKLRSAFESTLTEWEKVSNEVLKILAEDTPGARRDAIDLSMGEGEAKFEQAGKNLDELVKIRLAQAQEHASVQSSRAGWIRGFLLSSVAGAIILAVVLSFVLIRTIITPLGQTVSLLKDIAEGEGDLTKRLAVKRRDEIGELAHWFNSFVDKIHDAIRTMAQNTHVLASSAEELNSVSQQLSSSSDKTAAQVSVVSAASEQVRTNVQTVAAGAEEMSASIKEISKNTNDAARVAKEAVEVAEKTNATIAKLGGSSAEIGNVIKVITSIAEQTNLLALNATIEAARAGEAGKGFAVVANEVKELAKQTGQATEDISQKISAIQHDTQGAVEAIGSITKVINQINDIANTIASAVEEQSVTTNEMSRNVTEAAKGSNEIVHNMMGVAQAARSTASGATQTQAAAEDLARLASELQSLVSRFKYGEDGKGTRPVSQVKENLAKPPRMKPQATYLPGSSNLHER